MTALHIMNAISFAIVVPVLGKPLHGGALAHKDATGVNIVIVNNQYVEPTPRPLKAQLQIDCDKALVNFRLGLTIIRLRISYKICRIMPKCAYQICIFY